MSMESWAKNEIEMACKRENPNWDGKSFDYGIACYQSALKAFNSLLEDGHSGMSIAFTKQILNRLIDRKPLSPITENDKFNLISEDGTEQCSRYSGLFKKKDGTYSDIDRVVFCDIGDEKEHHCHFSHFSLASKLVNSMFPIKLPYDPPNIPYKVYGETYTLTENGEKTILPGRFNAVSIFHILAPNGDKITVNKSYIETVNGFEERKE